MVDVSDYYVTPGLIDLHTHVDAQGAPLSLNPDHNTLRYGVTTAVDAGSSGWKTFEQFNTNVIAHATVRILAFLNISGAGMGRSRGGGRRKRNGCLTRLRRSLESIRRRLSVSKQLISSRRRWEAVDRAIKAAEMSKTVVMVDFQPKPGRGYRELLLQHMRPGDIQTHFYGRLTPQLDSQKKIQDYMWAARKKGVLFDVGHGSGSLWFRIAVPAIQQGFLPDTISTDMHKDSMMLPRATMTNVMSEFLAMGLTLEQVIERSTLNPAKAIRRPDLGSIEEGGIADIAVLELQKGQFAWLDSGTAN